MSEKRDFSNTIRLTTEIMRNGGNVLLIGDRGIGKSDSMEAIMNKLAEGDQRRYIVHNLNQVRDPSLMFLPVLKERQALDHDFRPLYQTVENGAVDLALGEAMDLFNKGADADTVVHRVPVMEKYLDLVSLSDLDRDYVGFDEITDAGEAIHSFLLSVLLSRTVGGHKLRTKSFLLAGTPPESSSSSTGVSRPFLERAAIIRLPAPTPQEWLEHEVGKIPAWYSQFIRKTGSAVFYVKEEEGAVEDFVQKPSPRQHSQVAKMLRSMKLAHTNDDVVPLIQAYAGPVVAAAYSAFISSNLEMYTFNDYQRTKTLPENFQQLMYLIDDFVATVESADERVTEHATLVDQLVSRVVQFPKHYKVPVPHNLFHGYILKGLTTAGSERYNTLLRHNKEMAEYRVEYAQQSSRLDSRRR
jgi:MoxR-like ATPase